MNTQTHTKKSAFIQVKEYHMSLKYQLSNTLHQELWNERWNVWRKSSHFPPGPVFVTVLIMGQDKSWKFLSWLFCFEIFGLIWYSNTKTFKKWGCLIMQWCLAGYWLRLYSILMWIQIKSFVSWFLCSFGFVVLSSLLFSSFVFLNSFRCSLCRTTLNLFGRLRSVLCRTN